MKLKVRKLTGLRAIIGLIGKKEIVPVFFNTNFGIHTFLMKEPIDVIILDSKNYVKKMRAGLEPNRFFLWNPMFDRVVELPSGTLKKLKISVGQKLTLRFI